MAGCGDLMWVSEMPVVAGLAVAPAAARARLVSRFGDWVCVVVWPVWSVGGSCTVV